MMPSSSSVSYDCGHLPLAQCPICPIPSCLCGGSRGSSARLISSAHCSEFQDTVQEVDFLEDDLHRYQVIKWCHPILFAKGLRSYLSIFEDTIKVAWHEAAIQHQHDQASNPQGEYVQCNYILTLFIPYYLSLLFNEWQCNLTCLEPSISVI